MSQSFLRVAQLPTDHPRVEIDLNVEGRFRDAVFRNVPGHQGMVNTGIALEVPQMRRALTRYQCKWEMKDRTGTRNSRSCALPAFR